MRRRWPIIAALGLGLPLAAVFATGCHEREVTYYRAYPEHGVYVEPGYGYYPYGYDGGHYYRHEREHAFRNEGEHHEREREHSFHERGYREHHG